MTNPNLTHIAVILDRSGSMERVRADTLGSLNTFIAEQQKQPGEAHFTLVLFNDHVDTRYLSTPLDRVPALTTFDYVPNGWTALLDAIGMTISKMGSLFALMKEEQRPGKVLIVILTDGQENHSKEYTLQAVSKLIEKQKAEYAWQFMFLGADLGAIRTAGSLGIDAANAMAYTASSAGMHNVMRSVGQHTNSYRGGAVGASLSAFSPEERSVNAPLPGAQP